MQSKESKTTWHFSISIIKSFFRIFSFYFLYLDNILLFSLIFIIAEVLGIIEEL